MRAFQIYRFLIRSKIPFTDWPGIAHAFFREQDLHYKRFHYYFESVLLDGYRNPCERAATEHPELGLLAQWEHPRSGSVHCSLSNMDGQSICAEDDIMQLLSPIYRRYGFDDTYLVYQDVDFFGEAIPALEDCQAQNADRFCGSSLTLYRDGVFRQWSSMDLRIEIVRNGQVLDATAYRDTLARLLPGVKCMSFVDVRYTPEEQQFYAQRNESVIPFLEQAQHYFSEKLQSLDISCGERKPISMAGILKKLCKKYGFTYVRCMNNLYSIEKRSVHGHFITLEVDVGRIREEDNVTVDYKGAGFDLRLLTHSWIPADAEETASHYDKLLQIVADAESTVLLPIADQFPETPAWYTLS